MKKVITLISGIIICATAVAQTFHKYYSASGAVGNLYRCIQTSDGGYAAVGMAMNTLTFDNDFLIVKTDANGNTVWSNVIAYNGYDSFDDLVEASNGDIVAAGSSTSASTFNTQAVVARFDATGAAVWRMGYDISGGSAVAKAIEKDAAGNFYVLGSTNVSSSLDYYLMKINSTGGIVNQQIYVSTASDMPLALLRSANGDLYFSGWYNDGSGDNIHLFKTDSTLALTWNVLIDGAAGYFCYDLKEKLNNNVVLAGRFDDNTTPYDMFLAEFNPAGNPVWAKSYSPNDSLRCYAYGLTVNPAGALAVAGIVEDSVQGTLVAASDINGNISWSKRIGAATGEYASGYGIGTTSDGGYVVSGPRGSVSGNSSAQLLKTTATGTFTCTNVSYALTPTTLTLPTSNAAVGVAAGTLTQQAITFSASAISGSGDACAVGIGEAEFETSFRIFPNPAADEFRILNPEYKIKTVDVYNLVGEKVFSAEITGMRPVLSINAAQWSSGIYFIRIGAGKNMRTQKIIIEKGIGVD